MSMIGGPTQITPRHAPMTLWLRLLFGSQYCQFGWLFFGFVLFFYWALTTGDEGLRFWKFHGPLATTTAHVLRVQDNPAYYWALGSRKAVTYVIVLPGDKGFYNNTSYTNRTTLHYKDTVTAEYRIDHPAWSRIRGMQEISSIATLRLLYTPFGPFLIVGLVLILVNIRKGLRNLRLLRESIQTTGTLVNMQKTHFAVEQSPLYRLTLRFTTESGQSVIAEYCTLNVDPSWKTLLISPEAVDRQSLPPMPLLYLPTHPRTIWLTQDINPSLIPDGSGTIPDNAPWRGLLAGILPLLAIGVNAVYITWVVTHF